MIKIFNKKQKTMLIASIFGALFLYCLLANFIISHNFMEAVHTIDISHNLEMVNAGSDTVYFDCDYSKQVCKDSGEWYAYGMDKIKKFYLASAILNFLSGYSFVGLMASLIANGKLQNKRS